MNEIDESMEENFPTKDLMSAAYIYYTGIKLSSDSNGYDKKTRSWIFLDPEKCRELDFTLRNREASVEVIKYESARRTLLGMAQEKSGNGRK